MSNKIKKTWNLIYKMWDEQLVTEKSEYGYLFAKSKDFDKIWNRY